MSTIITRETGGTAKGSPLTNAELDANFININGDKIETTTAQNGKFWFVDTHSLSISTVTQTVLASFAAATFGSCKFIIQVYDTVSGERQVSELFIVHDGTTAYATEYGIIFSGAAALAEYDVDINSGNVRLLVTSASTNATEYKTSGNLIGL